MQIDAVVVNASPLITLFRSGLAALSGLQTKDPGSAGGYLPSVGEAVEKLRNAGLWLSDDLVRLLKMQAGE